MQSGTPADGQRRAEAFGRKHRTGLVTLLFTDMVESTALKQSLGDTAAADLFREHHQLIRDLLQRFPQGEEIETAGDSFLLIFATPSDAIRFALLTQAGLRRLQEEREAQCQDRIGIHVGEVVVGGEPVSGRSPDLFGIQIDTCARVLSLARGGQVLMTRPVFDSARQVLKGQDIEGIGALEWLNYGCYLLKGLDEPVEICEVREAAQPDRGAPVSSEKAHRQIRAGEEPVLGWRPAVGQGVPATRWTLEKKLGEGGFGEVWLGRHQHTKERRVFKFCFQAERVRFLKREMTLFRLLKERVGDHPKIVRMHDIMLDQPPFYVEMDYVDGTDLRSWCAARGGVEAISLETRVEIVAQAAEGLQAAHEAGIIHRDVKPANILIGNSRAASGEAQFEVKLTDFGIGQVVSEEYLKGITRAGFTATLMASSSSSHSGTQLYMAPELLAGKPASLRSDIYSLGVVLFQLLVGDFTRPLTADWVNDIPDLLLREDLQHCVAGRPQDRFDSAGQLARSLRRLPQRRIELQQREAELKARERAAYRRGVWRTASLATVVVGLIAILAAVASTQWRRAKLSARELRRNLYVADLQIASHDLEQGHFGRAVELVDKYRLVGQGEDLRGFEWRHLWYASRDNSVVTSTAHHDRVESLSFSADGRILATGSKDHTVKLWRYPELQEIRTIDTGKWVQHVALSPDGTILALSNFADQPPELWDVASGRRTATLSVANAVTSLMDFSPDGRFVLTNGRDGKIRFWDVATRQVASTIDTGRPQWVRCRLSQDGNTLIISTEFDGVMVWDIAENRLTGSIGDFAGQAFFDFSPDGRHVAMTSTDKLVKLWDIQRRQVVGSFPTDGFSRVTFSPDGQALALAGQDSRVKLWSVTNQEQIATLQGHMSRVLPMVFTKDGKRLVTGSLDGTFKLWETTAGPDRNLLTGHYANPNMSSIGFSADGKFLAFPGTNKTVEIWDKRTQQRFASLTGHNNNVLGLAFSPVANTLATSDEVGTIILWDVPQKRATVTVCQRAGWVPGLAVSPDGKILASSLNNDARLWDAQTGAALATLPGHQDSVTALAFSPNGKLLATSSGDSTVKLWDIAARREVATLRGHTDWGNTVVFSPDGGWLASSSDDGTVVVWDVETRKLIHRLPVSGDMCGTLALSADGQTLAAGSADNMVRLWKTVTWQNTLTLKGHKDAVMSLAFSPDGQTLASGSTDHTVRLWRAPALDAIDAGRAGK